jgi:hypothetical protein
MQYTYDTFPKLSSFSKALVSEILTEPKSHSKFVGINRTKAEPADTK